MDDSTETAAEEDMVFSESQSSTRVNSSDFTTESWVFEVPENVAAITQNSVNGISPVFVIWDSEEHTSNLGSIGNVVETVGVSVSENASEMANQLTLSAFDEESVEDSRSDNSVNLEIRFDNFGGEKPFDPVIQVENEKLISVEESEKADDDSCDREVMEHSVETKRTPENESVKKESKEDKSKPNNTGNVGTGKSKETGVKSLAPEANGGSVEDNQRENETGLQVSDGRIVVNEQVLLSEMLLSSPPADLITNLDGFEDLRELGSSRFGTVRLLRRANSDGTFELFAAKFYNVGGNQDVHQGFEDQMKRLLELSHPHVMQIVGVIPPTKVNGPILLTPYSEIGSLEKVLSGVRMDSPPPNWNDETKLGLIVSLVSGLNYLHKNGIVHRELKPTDLIIQRDGSLRICGYATSIFEEHKYTKGTQVGGPSYMAPEVYDDELGGKKIRDPKTDVFSFGLILFELLFGQKVFPSTMSAAVIMRKALSDKPRDRPMIPNKTHKILQEIISRSWASTTIKRPPMDSHWKRMREVGFKLFPDIAVDFSPLTQ
jgi:hypothetical protein